MGRWSEWASQRAFSAMAAARRASAAARAAASSGEPSAARRACRARVVIVMAGGSQGGKRTFEGHAVRRGAAATLRHAPGHYRGDPLLDSSDPFRGVGAAPAYCSCHTGQRWGSVPQPALLISTSCYEPRQVRGAPRVLPPPPVMRRAPPT